MDRVQIGDEVRFVLAQGCVVDGKVLYIPVATGDAWIIHSPDDGLVYVQTYMMMMRTALSDSSGGE